MKTLTASEWRLNSRAAHLSQMARSRELHLSGCGEILSCEVIIFIIIIIITIIITCEVSLRQEAPDLERLLCWAPGSLGC